MSTWRFTTTPPPDSPGLTALNFVSNWDSFSFSATYSLSSPTILVLVRPGDTSSASVMESASIKSMISRQLYPSNSLTTPLRITASTSLFLYSSLLAWSRPSRPSVIWREFRTSMLPGMGPVPSGMEPAPSGMGSMPPCVAPMLPCAAPMPPCVDPMLPCVFSFSIQQPLLY